MSVSHYTDDEPNSVPKRVKTNVPLVLSFSEADKQGTIQPHDDALVVTFRIGGYDVRRVMIDQGSAAEIMYPDLFKGLGLKPNDLSTNSSPLVSFEGKMVVPRGQIRLPVQAGWMLYHYSWKKMYCLKKSLKLIKCRGKLLGFGYPRTENCTSAHSLGLIYCVSTQRHQSYF